MKLCGSLPVIVYCLVHVYEILPLKLRGSLLVIVYCLIVEFCNLSQKEYVFGGLVLEARTLIIGFEGLLFMLYPLIAGSPDRCLLDQVS